MAQRRTMSLIEVLTSQGIGFIVAYIGWSILINYFGFQATKGDTAVASMIFSTLAVVRQYIVRRWFNRRHP